MTSPRRVVPCLLLSGSGLVKTRRFSAPQYLGDAVNAVRIFNDCQADELILLDIHVCRGAMAPRYELIAEIVSEAFMPVCYGGGVTSVEQVRTLFRLGVEKVAICSSAMENPEIVRESSRAFGSQSIVGVIEVRKKLFGGFECHYQAGKKKSGLDPVTVAKNFEAAGAGEIMVNNIDRDGEMTGYDIDLMASVCEAVNIPVIACGGAGKLEHIRELFEKTEARAAAAGSLFVFHGPHRGVLINYPTPAEIKAIQK